MKSKGAIKFFILALTLVCIFHLSFTFVANNVERDAREYAAGDVEKQRAYLDSIGRLPVYNLFVREYTYQQVKERELNLGLDLRGGMHVMLEVDIPSLINELAGDSDDETYKEAMRLARERFRESPQADFVTIFKDAFTDVDPDARLAAVFATPANQEHITFNSTNDQVASFLRREAESSLEITFNIIRTRIDRFGVAQPNIQMLEGSGRISVELPGADDPERVRRILQQSAKLEFYLTYENEEVHGFLDEANSVLRDILELERDDEEITDVIDDTIPGHQLAPDEVITSEDPDDPFAFIDEPEDDTLQEMVEPGDTVVDEDPFAEEEEFDTFEDYEREFPLFAYLQPATDQDGFLAPGPVVGYTTYRDTAKINDYLSRSEVRAIFPPDLMFAWTSNAIDNEGNFYALVALRHASRDQKAVLSGESIITASSDFGEQGNPLVNMTMDSEGARIWRRVTGENIGRSVAITIDGRVLSYPTVQAEIGGGRSQITGNFTIDETQDIALLLRSGRLPLSVNIVQEAVVGPTLGMQSIRSGTTSLIVGIFLVLLFMIFYYNRAGVVANIALILNLFFIIGILASLGAALTLPGIAGIVLTMGMSVDANVLIFQRIREEMKEGKGIRMAIADGYKNAYSSIIDANLTTLLTAFILYAFGSGPVHGFATVLIIGILTSLFSAIFITRLVFEWALNKEKIVNFGNKFTIGAFENFNIDFISKRKLFYTISGGLILLGLVSIFTRGFEMGVDFKGGYSYVVHFDENADVEEVRTNLTDAFEGHQPEVKTFGAANQLRITTSYLIDDDSDDASARVEGLLKDGLAISAGSHDAFEIMSTSKVGPTMAEDIKQAAIWAVIFSLIVMFLYIFIRFKKWQFGAGALFAVFHDVLVILAIFSIFKGVLPFSLEIDQAFIAALLTVVGYSINDSVVVFDRIRENLSFYKKKPLIGVINKALNDVLARTFVTSFTTLLVVLILFVFGGEMIRGFAFALLIGVIVGTYSSIFIATPALIDLQKKQLHQMRAEALTADNDETKKR